MNSLDFCRCLDFLTYKICIMTKILSRKISKLYLKFSYQMFNNFVYNQHNNSNYLSTINFIRNSWSGRSEILSFKLNTYLFLCNNRKLLQGFYCSTKLCKTAYGIFIFILKDKCYSQS